MPLEINRIRGLCFDVDGTLSDTDDQFEQTIEQIINPIRFIFPNQNPRLLARKIINLTESPGNFLIGIPDKFRIDDELAAIGDLIYRKGHNKPGSFLLVAGVIEMLNKLFHHFPLSIVSARGARSTQIFLNQFNLKPFFKCVVTAQTCEYTKPYPDPIIWAAKQMEIMPRECLMIGDTTVDIRSAKAAGAQAIGVLCGFGQEYELRRAGADLILDSTALITDILLTFP